ncbi:MAG: homoserine dehydrogenase [Candidatus Sumerlaeia bacterium]
MPASFENENAPLKVGMIGFGNIGTGVVNALNQNRTLLDARLPHPIQMARIADIDIDTKRRADYDPAILTKDTDALINDPDIHVILELTGTMEPGRTFIEKALQAGKHVVTANKALMAVHGMDLIRVAVENEVCLLFEAAVGGGIPLIRTLHQSLAGNDIEAVRGIINGTANYILTQMSEQFLDFQTALGQAQELGYAEPDPTFDVEGQDTAHKLAILATLCYGQDIRFNDVPCTGITRIEAGDIAFARELGYVIKLLGVAVRHDDASIEVRVHPCLLPHTSRLAGVNDVYNAVRIDGNLTGSVMLSGRGAGPAPTSSAIIADLMALASGLAEGGLLREMRLCLATESKKLRPMEDLETRYFMRFYLSDQPGALAQVLSILGQEGVSVQSIKQVDAREGMNAVPVFVLSHQAREAQLQAALRQIRELDVNQQEPFIMHIEEIA